MGKNESGISAWFDYAHQPTLNDRMNLNREGEKKCGGASATLSNRIEKSRRDGACSVCAQRVRFDIAIFCSVASREIKQIDKN
jgi:hypothetical protein